MVKVKLAIPKGSLEKATFELLEKAWYEIYGRERTYRPVVNDPEIELKMLRPQEIPVFVAEGLYDVGITGGDWVRETGADVENLLDLRYGRVRMVLAVPKQMNASSLSDLLQSFSDEQRPLRISTEYLNISSQFVKNNPLYKKLFREAEPTIVTPWWKRGGNDMVFIYLSFGATEAKPPEETDAIVDITETGTTLEQNNLKPIETVLDSSARLVANRRALAEKAKRQKIYDILTLLKGVIDAERKLHVFVNVKKENLEALLSQLPALKKPTIAPLSDKAWYSVNTVVDRDEFVRLLPNLRKLAQGLVVHEPQQILPLEEIARDEKNE